MIKMIMAELKRSFQLVQNDIGTDAVLEKKGMHFEVESYEVKGLGHLCTIRMKAMGGMMKMETVVLAAEEADMPLINFNRVIVPFNTTQMVELYDNQLQPLDEAACAAYERIKNCDSSFKDYQSGPHWYDTVIYPFSYAKKKGGDVKPFDETCRKYLCEYLKQAGRASKCDSEKKKEKTEWFAQNLINNGGPAVDQMTKLFGRETAERLVLGHMYNVR